METAVKYDEGNDVYELGIVVDGAFVSVYTIAGSTVRARIEAQQAANTAETSGSSSSSQAPPAPAA